MARAYVCGLFTYTWTSHAQDCEDEYLLRELVLARPPPPPPLLLLLLLLLLLPLPLPPTFVVLRHPRSDGCLLYLACGCERRAVERVAEAKVLVVGGTGGQHLVTDNTAARKRRGNKDNRGRGIRLMMTSRTKGSKQEAVPCMVQGLAGPV
jgi:hypothetical protein